MLFRSVSDWKGIAGYLWRSYFNADIAELLPNAAGIGVETITGATGTTLGTMQSTLAYSGIETGVRPFGDTGIVAMFNDANDFGFAMNTSLVPVTLRAAAQGVSNLFMEFAGMLADTSVLRAARPNAVNGVLSYKTVGLGDPDIAPSSALIIDLREATWTFPTFGGGTLPHSIGMKQPLIDAFITADPDAEIDYQDIGQWYADNVPLAPGVTGDLNADIDRISVALEDAGRPVGINGPGILLTLLNDSGMTYEGNAGINFVIGGTGNDTLRGGTDADTFVFQSGQDVVLDFTLDQADLIGIDRAVFGGVTTTAAQMMSYASLVADVVIFDFGAANVLTLQGVSSLTGLEGQLFLI